MVRHEGEWLTLASESPLLHRPPAQSRRKTIPTQAGSRECDVIVIGVDPQSSVTSLIGGITAVGRVTLSGISAVVLGIDGLGVEDRDPLGSILNVTEYRYEPWYWPGGWDPIGGPELTLFDKALERRSDTAGLAQELLPVEEGWLDEATR
jgi:hypothetical protein